MFYLGIDSLEAIIEFNAVLFADSIAQKKGFSKN